MVYDSLEEGGCRGSPNQGCCPPLTGHARFSTADMTYRFVGMPRDPRACMIGSLHTGARQNVPEIRGAILVISMPARRLVAAQT